MNAFLHLPALRRRLLCEESQQRLGLIPASIEKDFWVCWTLRELFGLPQWGEHLTFKGWRRDYEAMRKEMFFDEPPSFDEVLAVIKHFEDAFNQ